MGSPQFAVPSLDILLRNGYNIVGVVTAVDKLGGRGRKQLQESAVKKFALKHGLKILQPKNLKSTKFGDELRSLGADLQVVVAFRMLPEVVWSMPTLGTINLHGSLLPKYRGAAPINWAVIKGEHETGLTTFFIQQAIDTGDLLLQKSVPIYGSDTAGDLHDRMMPVGADLVLATVQQVFDGDYQTIKQDHTMATQAPKLRHESCQIDLTAAARDVRNLVRGLNPWPVAWLPWHEDLLKVYQVTVSDQRLEVGETRTADNKLLVGTSSSAVALEEVQVPGRRRMKIADFLNGNPDIPKRIGS